MVLQLQPYNILIFNSSGVYSVSYTVGMSELSEALPRTTWCLVARGWCLLYMVRGPCSPRLLLEHFGRYAGLLVGSLDVPGRAQLIQQCIFIIVDVPRQIGLMCVVSCHTEVGDIQSRI